MAYIQCSMAGKIILPIIGILIGIVIGYWLGIWVYKNEK